MLGKDEDQPQELPRNNKAADFISHFMAKEYAGAGIRQKDWLKQANRAVEIYEAGTKTDNDFNILYSNTETMLPALYNNTPRPVVSRRFRDEDPLGKTVARLAERTLEFLLDNADPAKATFDDLMTRAVTDALVPGRGLTRFGYSAVLETEEPGEGVEESEPVERIKSEEVTQEHVAWERVRFGYGSSWAKVPWMAIDHFMTREELIANFGREKGSRVKLDVAPAEGREGMDENGAPVPENAEEAALAHVVELWDKSTKRVRFFAPGTPEDFLRDVPDPLQLRGFFPTPKPLMFFSRVKKQVPVPLYIFYEEQANELNLITQRIRAIIKALKVRGFYNSGVQGLDTLLEAEDNTMIPADMAAFDLTGSVDRALYFIPIEKLVSVLQQLYLQRSEIKQVIYEITGMSDIIRGSTAASETATAQTLKSRWGSMRLSRGQKQVQAYARDCMRIMAEIALSKFSKETIFAMTGLSYPSQQEKQQALAVLQQAKMLQQEPPARAITMAELPTWEELNAIFQNDFLMAYRVDIETNSTVDADATEDKQNITEFLNALAQFLNGVAPLVETGTMPFGVAKAILLTLTRRFRFGGEVEDLLAQMQDPKAQQQGGEAGDQATQAKMAAEMQLLQGEAKVAEAKAKAAITEIQRSEAVAEAKAQAEMEKIRRDSELAAAKHAAAMRKLTMEA